MAAGEVDGQVDGARTGSGESEPATERRDVIVCAGIYADLIGRTIHALGRLLPATAVSYSEASPERPGTDRVSTPEARRVTEMIYKTPERIAAAIARPIQAMPEALHFNLLCENGWWVEATAYPEEDLLHFGDTRMAAIDFMDGDATDLLAFYAVVAARETFVPTAEEIDLCMDDPWGGLAPGSWDLVDL